MTTATLAGTCSDVTTSAPAAAAAAAADYDAL